MKGQESSDNRNGMSSGFDCVNKSALLFRLLVVMAMVLVAIHSIAQKTATLTDRLYGNDPLLYNGKLYAFFPPSGTGGSQYLLEQFDKGGKVTLRGVCYSDCELNYDIYNQKLILRYYSTLGSANLLELSAAWLESFDMAGRHFEIIPGADTSKRIYQVLGNAHEKLLYYYRKDFFVDSRTASKNRCFTDAQREMMVMSRGKMLRYKNNRGFIEAFRKNEQDEIKKYLRKHRIRVRKANCNTLRIW